MVTQHELDDHRNRGAFQRYSKIALDFTTRFREKKLIDIYFLSFFFLQENTLGRQSRPRLKPAPAGKSVM